VDWSVWLRIGSCDCYYEDCIENYGSIKFGKFLQAERHLHSQEVTFSTDRISRLSIKARLKLTAYKFKNLLLKEHKFESQFVLIRCC
jgi:hypothetical protein